QRPYVANTFLYSAGAWRNLTSSSPAPGLLPLLASMAWSGQTRSVVLVASIEVLPNNASSFSFPVVWVYYQGAWKNVTGATGVVPDATLAGIAANVDGTVLAFGGTKRGGFDLFNWFYAFSVPANISLYTAAPAPTDVATAVSFNDTATSGIAPMTENLTFGDGSSALFTNLSFVQEVATHAHVYATTGTFHASLTLSDFAGRSTHMNATVQVNGPLTVGAISASPSAPTTGKNVTFNVTVAGGTTPYRYAWTLATGTSAAGTTASHTYGASGSYPVSVTVTDAVGKQLTRNLTLTVTASASAFSLSSGVGLYALIGVILLLVVILGLVAWRMRRKAPPTMSSWMPPAPGSIPPPAAGSPPPPPGPPPGTGAPPNP
ncbi:MAG: PKD domain-containing protein, partial [Thermoplasmata archaeon]|nr:PKD domain-containing protein [Thermoplasmata archaeon]